MKIKEYIYILLGVVGVACSSSLSDDGSVNSSLQEVSIAIGGDISTRLAVEEDNGSTISLRWEDNDAIYMWAESEAGVTAFENTKFNIKYYAEDYTDAIFTANIEEMSEGTYLYKAAFPQPQEVSEDGNELKYTISSTQSGEYSDSNDIMIIPEFQGAALTENVDRSMAKSFKHLTHMLRIEIPQGRNKLNDDIVSLTINFPRAIAGEGWVNFDSESFTINEGEGSNSITVNLDEAYTAGSGDYIWVAIAAGDVTGDISFSATSEGGLISQNVTSYVDVSMAAGEITPLTITAGEIDFDRTYDYFTISVGTNNLNEDVESITLTAPSGALFWNGSSSVTVDYDASTKISDNIYYIPTKYGDIFAAGSIGVSYESANAIVTGDAIAGSSIAADGSNVSADVPYLLYEDFSSLISFNSGDNLAVGGTSSAVGDDVTIALSSHGLSQTGWTGDRIGSDGSGYIRVVGRAEVFVNSVTNYRGRLDSPALSGIKSGKSVKIKVEYNMGGAVSIGRQSGTLSSTCSFYGKYDYGYTTSTGTLAFSDGITTTNGGETGTTVTGTSTTSNSYTSGITWYSSSSSYNITSATSSTRITWRMKDSWSLTSSSWSTWNGNANAWLYLDNVKVSIASN